MTRRPLLLFYIVAAVVLVLPLAMWIPTFIRVPQAFDLILPNQWTGIVLVFLAAGIGGAVISFLGIRAGKIAENDRFDGLGIFLISWGILYVIAAVLLGGLLLFVDVLIPGW